MPTNAQPTLVLTQAVTTEGYFPSYEGEGGSGFYLGSIRTFAGNFVPDGGARAADGDLLSIFQNTALFSLYGTTYGGDGQTTFALPDLVGILPVEQRVIRGESDQGQQFGSPTLNIVQASLPASSGGTGNLVDNDQPSLPIRYVINVNGTFPSPDGALLDSIGMIQAFGGTFAPAGTVECDGRLLSITDYVELFTIIGTTYGGDGQTTFAVPDLRGRSIIGAGNGFEVGQVVGSSSSSIGLANLPTEMGGSGIPLDTRGPGLVLTQLIATEGYYPSRDGGFDNAVPVLGEIVAFAGNYVPGGFMRANGQTLSIAQNTALFSLLGTNYGGNGQTTFALPDLTGRAVLGTNDEAGSPEVGTASGSPTLALTLDDFPALDFSGTAAGESLFGANESDSIRGLGGSDTLIGNGGNDVLDGGSGADVMKGGFGHDRYIVDDAGDQVIEQVGGGIDTVRSALNHVLAANVENLELGGTAIKGVGNALDNLITGNASANTLEGGAGNDMLDGGAGADTLKGGIGEDTYVVDNAGDKIVESNGAGTDTVQSSVTYSLAGQYLEVLVLTGSAAINGSGNSLANKITGNSAANVLNGGDGSDRLDGGGGADTLRGGLGNDTYVVDLASDQVFENNGEGLDTVEASISFSLAGQYVEALKLTGSGNINATGNGLANSLYGNSGNNLLNGGTGADEMRGGAGNDRYVVDNAGDKVFELDGEGSDVVEASVTFTLVGQYVEALTLTGGAAINGTGNGLANLLTGNGAVNQLAGGGGSDALHGMLGSDVLTGGAGADNFWFETALGAANVDRITDFAAGDDSIRLDRSIFAGIAADGALASGAFFLGTAAHDADDRIVYDKVSGNIYYDADGLGGAAAVLFAKLAASTAITAADFIVSG